MIHKIFAQDCGISVDKFIYPFVLHTKKPFHVGLLICKCVSMYVFASFCIRMYAYECMCMCVCVCYSKELAVSKDKCVFNWFLSFQENFVDIYLFRFSILFS